MCYRETAHYVVLCDRCGLAAPEGTGWWTPSLADRAALEAGWEMTTTEHLCPACAIDAMTDEAGGAGPDRPALPPVVGHRVAAGHLLATVHGSCGSDTLTMWRCCERCSRPDHTVRADRRALRSLQSAPCSPPT